MSYYIKNLENFFPNHELISVKVYKLTAAGDNYGGGLLGVNVTTKQNREIQLVAKVLPQNEYVQILFNSQITFRNEIGFYEKIVPCLKNFRSNFNLVPDFYGARFSLDASSTKIDQDGVLLIENLKSDGFGLIDRKIGFNLEQSRLILRKIAEFHGTTYALKEKNPAMFDEKIGPFLRKFKVFDATKEVVSDLINSILKQVEHDDICAKNLKKLEDRCYANAELITKKNNKDFLGAFNSITHNDFWTNNILVKIVDGKTVEAKFIDFQLYEFSSITRDLIFFLFTSVNLEILKRHIDDLTAYYFENFINFLTNFKCDISTLSFDEFLEEIAKNAKQFEYFHVMLMLRTIYAQDQDTKEVEDMKQEDFVNYGQKTSKLCKEKAVFVTQEFLKRQWI